MPIIMTSNGLTSPAIIEEFFRLRDGFQTAAVVVTADPEYREKNWKAASARDELEHIGFRTEFFDIEYAPPGLLLQYDVVFLAGGNPFHLLDQIRKTNADSILRELLAKGKVLSGSSAGSIVLGETIALIQEFDPQLNDGIGLTDLSGVGLTSVNLCPHHSRYATRYEKFEERICMLERARNIQITRLEDGEAICVGEGGKTVRI